MMLAGEGECLLRLEGVPRALGVRGFLPGVLKGVVLAPSAGIRPSTAGGEIDSERAGEAVCIAAGSWEALGVRG